MLPETYQQHRVPYPMLTEDISRAFGYDLPITSASADIEDVLRGLWDRAVKGRVLLFRIKNAMKDMGFLL